MDMVNGPLGGKIFRYALPLAATGILQQLFNAADIAVVGNFTGDLGETATAAVGCNSPVIGLLVNLFVGISMGSNVIIARSIGASDQKTLSETVHTSVLTALISGLFMTILGEALAGNIISILKVPAAAYEMAVLYLRVYLLGMPVILLYNFESAIFRSCGDIRTPLIVLSASGVLNVGLNLYFVCVLHMTVDGVALATVLSNLISSAALFVCLLRTNLPVRLSLRKLRVHGRVLGEMLRIGVPAGVQGMIFSIANIVVQSGVDSLGTAVMSASAAAYNLEIFAYYVTNAFGQTCTTFVGQNFGARRNERCLRSLKICLLQSFCVTAAVCCFMLVFGKPLLWLINPSEEVVRIGYTRMCYIFFAYIFGLLQEALSGYLRGFGVSIFPAACSVVGICGVRLIWIAYVFPLRPTFETIMIVYPISLAITALAILAVTVILKPSKRYHARAVTS